MKKVYCKNCIHKIKAFNGCDCFHYYNQIFDPIIVNKENNCQLYRRKWWKLWNLWLIPALISLILIPHWGLFGMILFVGFMLIWMDKHK